LLLQQKIADRKSKMLCIELDDLRDVSLLVLVLLVLLVLVLLVMQSCDLDAQSSQTTAIVMHTPW
jgi:hypothetical protein